MKSKRLYTFIFFLVIIVHGYGQQEPQFTQYMYTILPINPGIAGTSGICASLHYRQQWAGFADYVPNQTTPDLFDTIKSSPRDIMLTFHAPIKALHGGLGLTILNDAYGQNNDISVKLAYSFKMNIGGGVLGVGPSIDLLSRRIGDRWNFGQSADPNLINDMGESDMYMTLSFGAYYLMENKWYAGISGTQLAPILGGDNVRQKMAPHMYVVGGYSYVIPSNPNWTLKPSALLKTDFKHTQLDVTLLADWTEMIWFGASYRMIDAVALLVGARPFINSGSALRGLEVAISYDINTSQMMRYGRSFGGFEFGIKYCFNIVKPVTIYGYKGTRLLGNRPIEYR